MTVRAFLFCAVAPVAFSAAGTLLDVRDYGAKGDGETLDAPAIQRAIDAASAAGGGTVLVGPGQYVVANLALKDNVTLHLAKDATLLGSTNLVDYAGRKVWFKAVVSTFDANNVALEGEGVIDGRGWVSEKKSGSRDRWRDVIFYRCKDVRVEDVMLKAPGSWTFYLKECVDCVVRGVTIYSHANFNNDGIDIDAKNVLVENCVIDSDDDAICPKSDNPDFICENVEVRNCVIASNCSFIKFGTSSRGGFRNCYVHDCTLRPCAESNFRKWNGTDVISGWRGRPGPLPGVTDAITGISAVALEMVDGGVMENIRVSNITFDEGGVQTPVFIRLGRRRENPGVESYLRNCTIENLRGRSASLFASSITGVPGLRPSGITLRNFDLTLKGGGTAADAAAPVEEAEKRYPENRMFGTMLPAYGFYVRHADGIRFENVRTRLYGGREERPGVVTDDCTDITFDDACSFEPPTSEDAAPDAAIAPDGEVSDVKIRIGTYNIRNEKCDKNTSNAWDCRKDDLVALIAKIGFDAFGIQEAYPEQVAYIKGRLPQYSAVGEFRNEDRKSGESSMVFYRTDRFEKLTDGTFWLSETPDMPGSKSWGSAYTRICSWAILKDRRTGKAFCFANAHTDNKSALAREKGALLVVERMREAAPPGTPIVFVGDHNCRETDAAAEAVSKHLKDALYVSETPPSGPWRTFNGWKWMDAECTIAEALAMPREVRNARAGTPGADKTQNGGFEWKDLGSRIDYIYVSGGVRVLSHETHGDARPDSRLYPSDHFPVSADIVLDSAGRPALVVRIDDNHSPDEWRKVCAIFERHGFRCSLAVNVAQLDEGQGRSLKELASHGHEVLDHTPSHSLYSVSYPNAATFGCARKLPFVHDADERSHTVFFDPVVEATHVRNRTIRAKVTDGRLVVVNGEIGKPMYSFVKFASRDGVFGLSGADFSLRDFWRRDQKPPFDTGECDVTVLAEEAIQPCEGLLRELATVSREGFMRFGLSPPKVWIRPGGWYPGFSQEVIERIYGREFGYVGADSRIGSSKPCESRWSMVYTAMRFFDQGADITPEGLVGCIEKRMADCKDYILLTHMWYKNLPGGMAEWFEKTERFAQLLSERKVHVVTLGALIEERFGRAPNASRVSARSLSQ